MNNDIRLSVEFFDHPKTVKLQRRLGVGAIICLQRLWIWTAQNRSSGVLSNMDCEDVEIAARWEGKAGDFCRTLVELRFMDERGGAYALHGWNEHQEYASKEKERQERARKGANARWGNKHASGIPKSGGSNANDSGKLCSIHANSMLDASLSNAPNQTKPREIQDSTLTTFECLSSPGGDDIPPHRPDGQERPSGYAGDFTLLTGAENEMPPVGEETHTTGGADSAQSPNHAPPPCPYEQIRDMYHAAFPEHPRVALLNAKRKGAVKARWGDAGKRLRQLKRPDSAAERLAYFQRLFNKAAMSDFLTGKRAFRDGSVYRVDFDKLMSPSGFVGVIEGKYDNRPET